MSTTDVKPLARMSLAARRLLREARGPRGDTYGDEPRARRTDLLVAAAATVYTTFLVYAAGLVFLLLGSLVYGAGTVLFVVARRERNQRVFAPAELVLLVVTVVGAVGAVVGLATGLISI